jgi:hypothetical protein
MERRHRGGVAGEDRLVPLPGPLTIHLEPTSPERSLGAYKDASPAHPESPPVSSGDRRRALSKREPSFLR